MQFKNESAAVDWASVKARATDPYRAEIYRYAEAWAELMETRLAAEGMDNFPAIAQHASHDADTEGITIE